MLSLFSPAAQRRFEEIVNEKILCVFDFDGTLSPIVPQPEEARLPLAVKKRLLTLSNLAKVAVITGRSLADLRQRMDFEPHYLVGNHGLEGMPGWELRRETYEQLSKGWEVALQKIMRDDYDPGVHIENKGYSLSVHYRLARNHDMLEKKLLRFFEQLEPSPRIVSGKCVFSLLPQDAADKGQALEKLMEITQSVNAIYVGDDVTDEDVFVLERKDLMTVRIGYSSDSKAEFFLAHAGEITQLLDELIRRLRNLHQS